MTFAYWSILLAALLPLIWAGVAKTGQEGYDNHRPRVFLAELKGRARRANWAQTNAYESFPPYAAAVIIASVVGGDQMVIDIIAGVYLLARVLHGVFYIQDKAMARSLVWTLSFGIPLLLALGTLWLGHRRIAALAARAGREAPPGEPRRSSMTLLGWWALNILGTVFLGALVAMTWTPIVQEPPVAMSLARWAALVAVLLAWQAVFCWAIFAAIDRRWGGGHAAA
jgi:uncharacterized MAPEG superfamily protein